MQDVDKYSGSSISYSNPVIQPNDILKISIESQIPEAALPYNKFSGNSAQLSSLQLLQLDGYLVSTDKTITLPVLGNISVDQKTPTQLEHYIKELLITGKHLIDPAVNIRLLNAKFTVLGEVNQPGTFNFTEKSITLLQALGYAKDLTINGSREDLLLIRLENGIQNISHINLTSAQLLEDGDVYFIKPNDVIVVKPNSTKVKSAGFIGNASVVLTIASLALSSIILLTR